MNTTTLSSTNTSFRPYSSPPSKLDTATEPCDLPCDTFEIDVNFRRASPFNFDLYLADNDEAVMALAERAEALTRPNAVRSTKKKLGAALSCLLANLLRVRATDQRSFLAISLRNSAFYSVKTHVFGADHFRNVLRYLHELQLVDKKGGYKFDAGQGTKLRARASLMTFLSQHGFDLKGPVEKRTVLQGSDDCIAIKDGQTVLLTPSNDLVVDFH